MNRYDNIKNNIIYEDKIYYKKDGKQYIACLVKSKYADESDKIEFYLFENKITRNAFLCLDLIEYEKVERCTEQKKDFGWLSSRIQKALFDFEILPKHQQQKEIFACETEENRNKWLKILNENIKGLNTNNTYECNSVDENFIDEDEKSNVITVNKKTKPAVPPRNFNCNKINNRSPSQVAVINQLNYALLNPKKPSLNKDEIFYYGTFEELHKILQNINKPGVYAVSQKTKPESDCNLAIRVYENDHTPISSWNIYQNEKTNEYFLAECGLTFHNIVELCSYYTENDLPSKSNAINRLIVPYRYYLR